MSKKQKKDKAARSTRQLMGIEEIKDYCIATRMGNLVFFIIKPTNISVLPDSSISARIYALLNVVKGQAEIEMLALNSKESFERNKDFYRERLSQLAQESKLSQTTISNIFKRNNQPSLPTVNAICDACGITLAQFFTENDTANSPNAKSELDDSVAALKEDQREALAAFIKTIV